MQRQAEKGKLGADKLLCQETLTLHTDNSASLLTVRNVSLKCENIYAVRFPIISVLSFPLICIGYS